MNDESIEVSAEIGRALICVQLVEHLLGLLLQSAFRDESIPTVQEIEGAGTAERKATLGKLLRRLRAKVELDPELDAYLSVFLEERNRFVHHLIEGDNATASQEEIYRYYRDFSEELQRSSFRLIEPFFAALIKWYKGLDPSRSIDEDLKLYIEQAGQWKKSSEQLFRIRKTHHP